MSKPRTKPSRDMTPFWQERGFKPELAMRPPDSNEDPKGEIAYQREFYKAAQLKPPRVPNPASFPNSPSAREFLQRSRGLAQPRQSVNENTSRRQYEPDMSPDATSKKSTSTSPASNYSAMTNPRPSLPSLPSIMSIPRGDEASNNAFGDQRQLPPLPRMELGQDPRTRAAFLETGPRGPSNTLRPFF